MKKSQLLLAILMIAVISVTLTACGDDDPIVGTWVHHEEATYIEYDHILCFKSNGTGYERLVVSSDELGQEEKQFDFTY